MHRKKILAVAVAGALGMSSAGAALAAGGAESSYSVYGKLYPQVSSYDYKDATRAGTPQPDLMVTDPAATSDHGRRGTLDVSNSRIGFRGRESLSTNLSAIFQIETRVRFDTGAGNFWAGGRNSYVGLTGSYMGTVKLGNMDTAYKEAGDQFSMLGISSGNFVSHSNVLSEGPIDALSFHVRQPNVIMYESPKIVGLQFLGSWGKDELKGNPNRGINQILQSYALTYEMGSLYLAVAHEIHHDFFGYSNSGGVRFANSVSGADVRSNDTATRGTAVYELGQTKFSLDIAQIELKETGEATALDFKSYKNKRMALGVEHKFGPWTGAVSVVTSDEGTCERQTGACSTSGLDGRLVNLGVSYSFSRRTQAFFIFSQTKNGANAVYNTIAINPAGGSDPQQGEDITAIGAGVSHSF